VRSDVPAANPLIDDSTGGSFALYNTGRTSGMNAGTTNAAGGATLSSGQSNAAAANVGGSADVTVAGLVGGALLVLVGFHLLGFRFAFDASVGRK
jgi:hypothetical protein